MECQACLLKELHRSAVQWFRAGAGGTALHRPGFDVVNSALKVSQHALAFEEVLLFDLLILRLQAARQLLQLLYQRCLALQLCMRCRHTRAYLVHDLCSVSAECTHYRVK